MMLFGSELLRLVFENGKLSLKPPRGSSIVKVLRCPAAKQLSFLQIYSLVETPGILQEVLSRMSTIPRREVRKARGNQLRGGSSPTSLQASPPSLVIFSPPLPVPSRLKKRDRGREKEKKLKDKLEPGGVTLTAVQSLTNRLLTSPQPSTLNKNLRRPKIAPAYPESD